MTLEEFLKLRQLLITTSSTLKLNSQTNQMNVNNLQIVNTLTVHPNIIISISVVSVMLTFIGGISTYVMKDVLFYNKKI